MKKLQTIVISLVAIVGIGAANLVLLPTLTLAAPADQVNKGVSNVGGTDAGGSFESDIRNVINLILYIIGIAAVIMIVIGGLRYVLSNGDSSAIKAAKDTILYGVIGLVVAIIAFAIVNFVVRAFR